MTVVIWTVALVAVGVSGLWLAPRTWWGWVVNSAAEVLWFVYALVTGALPLAVMAPIWLAVNVRNAVVSRRKETEVLLAIADTSLSETYNAYS